MTMKLEINLAHSLGQNLNSALQAIATLNCGFTEPIVKFDNQLWADESSSKIKRWDQSSSQWVEICSFNGVIGDIANYSAPLSHVGSTGSAHGLATSSVDGFLSANDKSKLDTVAVNATANVGDVTLTGTQVITNKSIR